MKGYRVQHVRRMSTSSSNVVLLAPYNFSMGAVCLSVLLQAIANAYGKDSFSALHSKTQHI